MKKFRFTLQPVLELRKHQEQDAVQKLGVQLAAKRQIQAQMDSLGAEIIHARSTALPPHLGVQKDLFLQRLDIRMAKLHGQMREQDILVAEAQQAVREAQAAHQAVCKLKERKQDEWKQEWQRQEDRELAEIAGRHK